MAMAGYSSPISKQKQHCGWGTQPPPRSDRLTLLSVSPVLPSSAPAFLEYEVNQLSLTDHKHHTNPKEYKNNFTPFLNISSKDGLGSTNHTKHKVEVSDRAECFPLQIGKLETNICQRYQEKSYENKSEQRDCRVISDNTLMISKYEFTNCSERGSRCMGDQQQVKNVNLNEDVEPVGKEHTEMLEETSYTEENINLPVQVMNIVKKPLVVDQIPCDFQTNGSSLSFHEKYNGSSEEQLYSQNSNSLFDDDENALPSHLADECVQRNKNSNSNQINDIAYYISPNTNVINESPVSMILEECGEKDHSMEMMTNTAMKGMINALTTNTDTSLTNASLCSHPSMSQDVSNIDNEFEVPISSPRKSREIGACHQDIDLQFKNEIKDRHPSFFDSKCSSPKQNNCIDSPKQNTFIVDALMPNRCIDESSQQDICIDSPKQNKCRDSPKQHNSIESLKEDMCSDSPEQNKCIDSSQQDTCIDSPQKNQCINPEQEMCTSSPNQDTCIDSSVQDNCKCIDSPQQDSCIDSPKQNKCRDSPKQHNSIESLKEDMCSDSPKRNKCIDSSQQDTCIGFPQKNQGIHFAQEICINSPNQDKCIDSSVQDSPVDFLKQGNCIESSKEHLYSGSPHENNCIDCPHQDNGIQSPKQNICIDSQQHVNCVSSQNQNEGIESLKLDKCTDSPKQDIGIDIPKQDKRIKSPKQGNLMDPTKQDDYIESSIPQQKFDEYEPKRVLENICHDGDNHDSHVQEQFCGLNMLTNTVSATRCEQLNVVTPDVCSSQTFPGECKKSHSFETDENCEISFSPLIHDDAEMEKDSDSNENHLIRNESDEAYHSVIQHARYHAENEIKDKQGNILKSEELAKDIISPQQCSLLNPEIPFVPNESKNDENVEASPTPRHAAHVLNFSPLYTQVRNEEDDYFNQNDVISSYSQRSYKLVKFSPLKNNQMTFPHSPSSEKDDHLTNELLLHTDQACPDNKRTPGNQNVEGYLKGSQVNVAVQMTKAGSDGNFVSESDITLSEGKENKSESHHSILLNSNSNPEVPKPLSTDEVYELARFSPLVKTECQIKSCYIVNDCSELPSSLEKKNESFHGSANQVVPNDDINQSKTLDTTVINNEITKKKITEGKIHKYEKYTPELVCGREIQRGKPNDCEIDEFETKNPARSITTIRLQNDNVFVDEVEKAVTTCDKERSKISQNNILLKDDDKASTMGHDSLGGHDNTVGEQSEQVVPGTESDIAAKGHEGCHEQSSLYDTESIRTEDGNHSLAPHRSSFQWKSVYKAVLVNDNDSGSHNRKGQRAIGDHLESITPLPSQLKRPRSLRVGLSKKQKVRHLHNK